MTHRYSARRHARWSSNDASFNQLIHEDPSLQSWERPSNLPAIRVTEQLSCALECFYAGDRRRGEIFLRRAIRNADRLIAEKRYLDTDAAEAGHPMELGQILRGRSYAQWLLGENLCRKELRQAAEHIAIWCLTKAEDCAGFDFPTTMDRYMQAVRAAMIACDLDYTGELLKAKRKLRWHYAEEHAFWTRLVQMYPEVSDAFDIEFEALFDRVRDPDFRDVEGSYPNCDMLALETGIIREMYIVRDSPHDPVDPQAVIEAVSS